METTPRFMTGTYAFTGSGLDAPTPVTGATYTVAPDKRAQLIYFRGGNSADAMVAVHLMRDGKQMRTFPMGAKGAMHIPLAVVEDLNPESVLTLAIAAPQGTTGHVVLDIGLIEI